MYLLRGRLSLPASKFGGSRGHKQSQSIMSTSNRKSMEDIFGSLVGVAATNIKLA